MAFPATTPTGMMGYGMVSVMLDVVCGASAGSALR